MSPADFARMPLAVRVSIIIERRISFYSQGLLIDTRRALSEWRKWMATEAVSRHV